MKSKLPVKKINPDSHILIILMGALGDLVRGLCLVSHIKQHLPGTRITWLVEPGCAPLVKHHAQIDNVIIFNRPSPVSGLWELYKKLKNETFDITLDLQRHVKSGFFSFLSKSKRKIGFNRRNAKELNWIFNNEQIGYFSDDLPKIKHYLEFTKYLGLPEPPTIEFGLSSFDLSAEAPEFSKQIIRPFIAVVMGSAWESKDWFLEGYQQLVEEIISSLKMHVILVGDKSQTTQANTLIENIDENPYLINLAGKTSLIQLTGVLREAEAGIGPDSGPGHLAAAVNTPYISLFGPTPPDRVAPFNNEHLVVRADVNCSPCYKKRCPGLDKICMRSITVDAILNKLKVALETRSQ